MKTALKEAGLAVSLLYILCSALHSIPKDTPSLEVINQEISESREKTRAEEEYLNKVTGQDVHPLELIEPLNKPEPVQEKFEWPLCWEISCADA